MMLARSTLGRHLRVSASRTLAVGRFSRDNRGGRGGRRSYDNDEGSRQRGPNRFTSGVGSTTSFQSGGSIDGAGWTLESLPPLEKDLYKADGEHVISDEEAAAFRKEHDIQLDGTDHPAPILSFEHAGFAPRVTQLLTSSGFPSPTPIQSQGWPLSLTGRDIVCIAQTGSGKTLGFMLPAIEFAINAKRSDRQGSRGGFPFAVVLAPTRELAMQISTESQKFLAAAGLRSVCVYGGASKGPQVSALRNGAEIVIATPGRLNDLLETGCVDFRKAGVLILDEADRMLDMGFEPQIRAIVDATRSDRQTLFWSATWDKTVQKIAYQFTNNPTKIVVGSTELCANPNVKQSFICTPPMPVDKFAALKEMLEAREPEDKFMIFTHTKMDADDLVDAISEMGVDAVATHGDKSQGQRERAMKMFKNGRTRVMVATDVAARGIDVKDITKVINFSFPESIDQYIHRIGRTGRAGAKGESVTLFTNSDIRKQATIINEIKTLLVQVDQTVPTEFAQVRESRGTGGGVGRGRGPNRFSGNGGGGGRFGGDRGGDRGRFGGDRGRDRRDFGSRRRDGGGRDNNDRRQGGGKSRSEPSPWSW